MSDEERKSFFETSPLTPAEQAARDEADFAAYLDALWEQFFITRNPAVLASFVRHGGEITDQETRDIIAEFLVTAKFKHSRARPNQQVDFFMAVKSLLFDDVLLEKEKGGGKLTLELAIIKVAEQFGIPEKTGETRFYAGKKLIGG